MARAMTVIDTVAAILLAAGKGERAGGGQAKQFRPLGSMTVLGRAVRSLRADPRIGELVLVVASGAEAEAALALAGVAPLPRMVPGGATRRESVANALHCLADRPDPPSHVLIHDCARPFVPAAVLSRLLSAGEAGATAAMPVLPVADTLVRAEAEHSGEVVPRDGLFRVQTPQLFHFETIIAAHAAWRADKDATDDAQMVRALGHQVALVAGDQRLEKITVAEDFARVAALNGIGQDYRTGTGYDVHRLADGLPLWLCGMQIPHSAGLAGHSDADVAIHALVDALLGALAEGDIGTHFPPSDPQWRGAPSARFLEFARDRVAARGGRIVHVDLTIICEAPRIGPHRQAMRARLSELLSIPSERVSLKATTTEGLGFTGRREGIAAQAAATIVLPADEC